MIDWTGTDLCLTTSACKRRHGTLIRLSVRLKVAVSVPGAKIRQHKNRWRLFLRNSNPDISKTFVTTTKRQEHSLERVLWDSYETSSSKAPCREVFLVYGRLFSSFDLTLR